MWNGGGHRRECQRCDRMKHAPACTIGQVPLYIEENQKYRQIGDRPNLPNCQSFVLFGIYFWKKVTHFITRIYNVVKVLFFILYLRQFVKHGFSQCQFFGSRIKLLGISKSVYTLGSRDTTIRVSTILRIAL